MFSVMMSCHVLDAITASRQHCSRLAVSWSLTAVGRTQSSVLERSYSDKEAKSNYFGSLLATHFLRQAVACTIALASYGGARYAAKAELRAARRDNTTGAGDGDPDLELYYQNQQ